MNLGNRQDPCCQEKVHYKMYKDGKQWVVAGLFSAFIATGLFTQPAQAAASTTTATETNQVAQSQTSAAAALQAKAVPLKTSSATAAKSSVAASSATSASSSAAKTSATSAASSAKTTSKTAQAKSSATPNSSTAAKAASSAAISGSTAKSASATTVKNSSNAATKANTTGANSSATTDLTKLQTVHAGLTASSASATQETSSSKVGAATITAPQTSTTNTSVASSAARNATSEVSTGTAVAANANSNTQTLIAPTSAAISAAKKVAEVNYRLTQQAQEINVVAGTSASDDAATTDPKYTGTALANQDANTTYYQATDGIIYHIATDGSAWVDGYTGTATDLVIATQYGGTGTAGISAQAFQNNTSIQKVTADSVTHIGSHAFAGDTALTAYQSAAIATAGYLAVDDNAFAGDTALTQFGTYTTLADLKAVADAKTVPSIAAGGVTFDNAFTGTKFAGDTSTSGTTTLTGDQATGQTVTGTDGKTTYPTYVASDGVVYHTEAGVTVIDGYQGKATDLVMKAAYGDGTWTSQIAANAFANNTTLQTVTLPDGVYAIGASAFAGATALTTVKGGGVTTIGDQAFAGDTNLASFDFTKYQAAHATGAGYISSTAFKGTKVNAIFDTPNGTVVGTDGETYKQYIAADGLLYHIENAGGAYIDGYNGTGSAITNGTLNIADNYSNTWVAGITANAFSKQALTTINVPKSVFSIAKNAFMPQSNATLTAGTFTVKYIKNNDQTIIEGIGQLLNELGISDANCNVSVNLNNYYYSNGSLIMYNTDSAMTDDKALTLLLTLKYWNPTATTQVTLNLITKEEVIDNNTRMINFRSEGNPNGADLVAGFGISSNINLDTNNLTTNNIAQTITDAKGNVWHYSSISLVNNTNGTQSWNVLYKEDTPFAYTADTNAKTVTITGYKDATVPAQLVIPDTIDGYRVTTIADNAFTNKGLISVTIPATVWKIGANAFADNQLTTLTFAPDATLAVIDKAAFSSNQLTTLTVPSSVTTIGENAFTDNQLATLTFAPGATIATIDKNAFSNNQLTTLTVPSSVTTIGENAFTDNQLATLTFATGTTIATIDKNAFKGNRLTTVTVPGQATKTTTIAPSAFANQAMATTPITTTKTIEIDRSIIPDKDNNTAMALVGFGKALQDALTTAGVNITLADVAGQMAITNVAADTDYWYYDPTSGNLKLPQNKQNLFGLLYLNIMFTLGQNGANGYQIINVPVDIKGLSNKVYFVAGSKDSGNYIQDAQTIVSDNSATDDLAANFSSMKEYQTLYRASDKTYWQFNAITKNQDGSYTAVYNQLTDFNFNASTGTITGYTGKLTAYLNQKNGTTTSTTLVIPDTINGVKVGIIGPNALASAKGKGFTTLTLGANVWQIGDSAAKELGLNKINWDASLSKIDNNAFSTNQLTTLTVPSSVATIGDNAFSNNQLATLTFAPGSVLSSIGAAAFAKNDLTQLTLPSTKATVNGKAAVITIGAGAFQDNQLTSVDLGKTIGNIRTSAFQGNAIQGTVTIPDGVITIDDHAFADNQITTVILGKGNNGGQIDLGQDAFSDNQITTITIPSNTNQQVDKNTSSIAFQRQFEETTNGGTTPTAKAINITINGGTNGTLSDFWATLSKNAAVQAMFQSFPFYFVNGYTGAADLNGAQFGLLKDDGTVTLTKGGGTDQPWNYDHDTDTLQLTSITKSGDYTMEIVTFNGYGFFVNLHVNTVNRAIKYTVSSMKAGSVTGPVLGTYQVPKTTYVDAQLTVNSAAYVKALSAAYAIGAENVLPMADGSYYQFDHLVANTDGTYTAIYNELSNFSFKQNDNAQGNPENDYTVTGYTGALDKYLVAQGKPAVSDKTKLVIPKTYNGFNVTKIGDNAFTNQGVTAVTIPSGIWSIGANAFANNKLTTVTLPNDVTVINDSAFAHNQLTAVHYQTGANTLTLGEEAFYDNQLKTVDLNGFSYIGTSAFAKNHLTGTLVIPSSVETIGGNAFIGTHYHGLNLPVKKPIYNDLSAVDFSQATNLKTIAGNAFMSNSLTTVTIPQNVTLINVNAFADNVLTSVNFNDATLVLGGGVFDGNEITSVTGAKNITYNPGVAATGTFTQQFVDPSELTVNVKVLSGYALENFKTALIAALKQNAGITATADDVDVIIQEIQSKTAKLTITDGNGGVWDYDPATDNLTIPVGSTFAKDATGTYELTYSSGTSSQGGKMTVSLTMKDAALVNGAGASTDPQYGVMNLVLNMTPDLTHKTALVTYVDDDELDASGKPTTVKRAIISSDNEADTTANYVATIPDGYIYVPDKQATVSKDGTITYQNVPLSTDGAGDFTIHLIHHHTYTTQQGTRIIDYLNVNGKVMTNPDGSNAQATIQHVNYQVDTDDVTGKWIATLENNADGSQGYPALTAPTFTGYTPDQDIVPAGTVPVQITSGSFIAATMQVATVTYTPTADATATATVTYVDDDNKGATLRTDQIKGAVSQSGQYTLKIDPGYELVNVLNTAGNPVSVANTSGYKVSYRLTADDTDNLVVHEKKATTYTLTTHYVDDAGETIAPDQSITGYTSGAGYSVATPLIAGYLYDHEQSSVPLTGTITTDLAITLVYRQDPSVNTSATISFVDTDAKDADGKEKVVQTQKITGAPGTDENQAITIPKGYDLAAEQLNPANWTANEDGTLTYTGKLATDSSDDAIIYLAHHYVTTTPENGKDGYDETHKTLKVTVNVTQPATLTTDMTPKNASQTLAYERTQTVDETDPTAAVTYGAWTQVADTGLSDINIPAAVGYTATAIDVADKQTYFTESATAETISTKDIESTGTYTHFIKPDTLNASIDIAVTYKATGASLDIVYEDKDSDNEQVGKTVTLLGTTAETGTFDVKGKDAGIDWDKYELAPTQPETVTYTFAAGEATSDNVTVYLVHKHNTVENALKTTQTVKYTVNGEATTMTKLQPNVQTIEWDTDEDLVTSDVLYTPDKNYQTVTTPKLDGYTADKPSVTGPTASQTDKPTDETITVTYTGNAADLTVTYEDKDNDNKQVGKTVTLQGTTAETGTIDLTDKDSSPVKDAGIDWDKYELAPTQSEKVPYTFAAGEATSDNVTVYLVHKHNVDNTLPTTRTVQYAGAGAATPKDSSQTIEWDTDTDLVTSDVLYTPEGTYTAVTVPDIPGYTYEITENGHKLTEIPATKLASQKDKPTDETITVTYTENAIDKQIITTNYVDENGKSIMSSTNTKVPTGEKYSTTPAVVTGYILDKTKLPTNASGIVNGAVTVTYVYQQLGSYQITPPNDGQEIDITYPNDSDDPKKTGNTTQVVPNNPGYTPVGPDGDLTPVDPNDPDQGYNLPHVPDDPTSNTTITYVANNQTITTNYVDEADKPVAPSTDTKVRTGEKYSTTPAVVTGYILDKTKLPTNASGIVNGAVTVTYVYQQLGSYQITPPNDGQEIDITYPNDPDDPKKTGKNTKVVPNNPGYTPVGPDGDLTPVDPNDPDQGYNLPHVPDDPTGNTTITYVANKQIITTNYVDEADKSVAPSTSTKVPTGEKYSTTPAVVTGYVLDGTKLPDNASGIATGAVTVTYVYKQLGSYQITPPNDGQEIDITYPNDPDDPDKTGNTTQVVPNQPGYTPVGPDGQDLVPMDPNDPDQGYNLPHVPDDPTRNTTITYVANKQTITTNYVDENGNAIAPKTSQTVKTGMKYSTTPAVVTGYILDRTKLPANASGIATGAVTVTYVYQQLGSYQITPPNDGQEIEITYPNDPDDPNKTGNTTQVVPNQPGYTPVGPDGKDLTPVDPNDPDQGYNLPHVPDDPTRNTTITYVANNQTITTNYVDETGKSVAPSTATTVPTGEKYSTTPAVVIGYILDGTKLPANASGIATGAVTVTYVYKQLGSYQITPPNDGQEIEITYPNDPENPNKTGNTTQVVPNQPGLVPVGPDGKDLTPVDPNDPNEGYVLPHVPSDPSQTTTITYRPITPGQPITTPTVPVTSVGAVTNTNVPVADQTPTAAKVTTSVSTTAKQTFAAKPQKSAMSQAAQKQAMPQRKLPQTSEQTNVENSTLGIGLLTAALSLLGLKRKRHDK